MSDIAALVRSRLRDFGKQRWALTGIILMVTCLLVASAVVASGLEYYSRNARSSSALNLIEVSAVAPSAQRALDQSGLDELSQVEGVAQVYPWYQLALGLHDQSNWPREDENPGAVWAAPFVPGVMPKVIAGSVGPLGPSPGEIVLPDAVPGGTLKGLLGKQIEFEYVKVKGPGHGEPGVVKLTVVAIIDNSIPDRAGQTPAYLAEATLAEIRDATGQSRNPAGPDTAFVRVADPGQLQAVQASLAQRGFAVSSLANQVPSLGALFDVLDTSQTVLAALTLLVALALGGSLGASWLSARTREIGLLKAIGWPSRRVGLALLIEYAVMGVISALVGIVAGVVASLVATTIVANQKVSLLPVLPWSTPPMSMLALVLVAVPGSVCLGGLIPAWRASRIEPDVALRDL